VRVLPQAFEVVIAALLRREDVDDNVAVDQEHPAVAGLAFDVPGVQPILLLGDLLNAFEDRLELSFARAAAQDEVVGDEGDFADVQQ
jgi:hypothetical protein